MLNKKVKSIINLNENPSSKLRANAEAAHIIKLHELEFELLRK